MLTARDWDTLTRGVLSGVVSAVVLQPLEVIKINLILQPDGFGQSKFGSKNVIANFFQAIPMIYRMEGVQGFYRGSVPSVLSSGLSAGLYFYILSRLESIHSSRNFNQEMGDFFSSATARSLSSLLVNPISIWRTRAQIIGYNEYRSWRHSIHKIYLNEGLSGFFKGGLLMVLKDFPFGGIFYLSYRLINKGLRKFADSDLVFLTSGLCAGMLATVITHPLEIVLAKAQANTSADYYHRKRFEGFRELGQIYKSDGVQGLFRGLMPRLIRKPLSNALTFFIFELLNKRGLQRKLQQSRQPAASIKPEPTSGRTRPDGYSPSLYEMGPEL